MVPGRKRQAKVQTKEWRTDGAKASVGSLQRGGNHLNQPKQHLFILFLLTQKDSLERKNDREIV